MEIVYIIVGIIIGGIIGYLIVKSKGGNDSARVSLLEEENNRLKSDIATKDEKVAKLSSDITTAVSARDVMQTKVDNLSALLESEKTDKEKVIVNPLTKCLITSYKEKMGYEASHWDWLPISFEDLMEVYDSFVEESGAEVLFGGTVCGAVRSKTGIEYIEVAGKFGIKAFKAKTYIDCTGDADLAAFSGLDYEMGDGSDNLQASSLCFIISGVDTENMNFWDIHWNDNSIWAKNGNNPKYPHIDINHVVPSVIGKGTMAFNAGHLFSADTTDESNKSINMIKVRKTA